MEWCQESGCPAVWEDDWELNNNSQVFSFFLTCASVHVSSPSYYYCCCFFNLLTMQPLLGTDSTKMSNTDRDNTIFNHFVFDQGTKTK